MKREVLVVAIHIGGIGIRNDFIDGDRTLDCFVLLVQNLRDITLEFVSFRLHILDGETDDCATNLHCHCVLRLQPQFLLQKDDRSELRSIVLNVETIMLALDYSVTAANTNVIDTHLAFMSSS